MKESQHAEWKESWRDDHLRWVCGFANAEGGVLVIGRNDKGRVVGVPDAVRLLEELPNKIRDLLGIVVEVNLREERGREYLEVVTPAYTAPISYRGRYYQRSGSTLQELKGAAMDRFLLRRHGRTWDGVPVPGVKASHLSREAIRAFRKLSSESGRMDPAALKEGDRRLIERLKLTAGEYLKRAAVLLLHPDPQRFVTGAFVKIGFFRSESDLVYHDEVGGHLFHQVRQTLDLLYTKYLKAAVTYEGIQRIERFPVPHAALREAVLNALVHRDYAVPAPTQVRVYDDRLSLWNPAVLPEGWTVDTLRGRHASHPFNPEIANTFFRAGEIEAWGRGIERIHQACREERMPAPDLRHEANGLWMEFRFSAAYRRVIGGVGRRPSTEVATEVTMEVATEVTTEVTTEVATEVTPEVRLLRVMTTEMNRQDLRAAVGLKNDEHFRKTFLIPAVERGLIEMTIPEKPTSRLQKYRITAAGRRLLRVPRAKGRAR